MEADYFNTIYLKMSEVSLTEVDLGFAEKVDTWKLKSKYFPSKIGGLPAWLDLESLPLINDMQCRKCTKPLIFLCQVYAPYSSKENCFHRTLFVFICQDGNCSSMNESSNIQVFRCQLPRINKYYSAKPSKEEEEEKSSNVLSSSEYTKLCRVCGSRGSKICGDCKLVSYCGREHQILDWKSGHKFECKNKELSSPLSAASNDILFPEYEIDLDPEAVEADLSDVDSILKCEEDAIKKEQFKNLGIGSFEDKDLEQMAAKETDKQFAKFRNRISHYPDQVLRYERNGSPLLVSSQNIPACIPKCENCGAERIFEFQIMPQLLVHLNVDSSDQSIDWGTILIYTCAQSCTNENSSYLKEASFKQDYT